MKIASTLFLVASLLAGCSIVFAQNQEDITLTTYYPAPYGEYNSLSANSFAVGSGASVPATSGVIAFESIDTSSGDLPGTIGDLYFDDGEATTRSEGLYYLGSSGWTRAGGGGSLTHIEVYTSSDPADADEEGRIWLRK